MPARPSRAHRYLEEELAELLGNRQRRVGVPSPLLDRALALIGTRLPASEETVSRRLVAAALARGPVDLARIERAARHAANLPSFSVLRRDGVVLAVRGGTLPLASTVYRVAVRAIVSWGMALVRQIAFQASTEDHRLVVAILTARASFRWLDRPVGWFWFQSERSPLVRAIEKVLQVAGSVRFDELGQVLFRRWSPENVPSRRALHALCAQVPSLRVSRQDVTLAVPGPDGRGFTPAEQSVLSLFQQYGPRVEGHRLHEIAAALGIASGQLGRHLRASPFVLEPRPGVFRLIGT